jgi:cytochrome P450
MGESIEEHSSSNGKESSTASYTIVLTQSNQSGVIPLIGHPTITFRRPGGDTFIKFMNEIPNDGLIIVPGFMNSQDILLSHPSTLAEVLVHKNYDFEKPSEIRNIIRHVLGDGLIVAEGDNHKFQRKHLIPAFSFGHIRDLVPVFWSKAGDLVGRLSAELYENPSPTDESFSHRPKHIEGVLDISQWSNKVTMDIIGVAGLGRQFNSLYSAEDELIDNYQEILEPSYEKGLYFAAATLLPRSVLAALPWKLNQRLDETTASLRRICRQLLRDKTDLAKASKEQSVDILSLLIKSNNFSDEMLVDEILTFLAAG